MKLGLFIALASLAFSFKASACSETAVGTLVEKYLLDQQDGENDFGRFLGVKLIKRIDSSTNLYLVRWTGISAKARIDMENCQEVGVTIL